MRLLKPLLLAILSLCASIGLAQNVPAPQIPLSGNVGAIGFPILNSGTFQMPADANVTFSISNVNTSAVSIKIISATALTATRTIFYPAGRFQLNVENATTGGQALSICGPTGACVTVPNDTTHYTPVWNDGTNYVAPSAGGSSGISGLSAGQVAIAGSATTITSSKPLAGTGAAVTTGPNSAAPGDVALFTGGVGQLTDGGIAASNIVTLTGTQALTNKSVNGVTLSAAGAPTSYLDNTGAYSVPAGGGGGGVPAFQNNDFGDSYTCSVQINVSGAVNRCLGNPLAGFGVTDPKFGYSSRIAAAQGLGLYSGLANYAGGGAMACDVSALEVYGNAGINYTNAKNVLMIGLNDALNKGTGTYESVYEACHLASIAWVAMPAANKLAATTCTNSGGTSDTTFPAVTGIHFASTGTLTCPITTTGAPIYIGQLLKDGSAGAFTYTIDSGSPVSATTAAATAISTTVGGVTQAVGLIRVTGIAAGSHTIHINVTAGDVSIYWYGSAPPTTLQATKTTFVGGVAVVAGNASGAATLAYNTDAFNDVAALQSDGLPIAFAPIRNGMIPIASYYGDGVAHPGDLMAGYIANVFLGVMNNAQSATYPVLADDTGTWPNPLYMVETKATGVGPHWNMDNTSQGGARWQPGEDGPSDTVADAVGCAYQSEILASSVFLHSETCPSTVSGGYTSFWDSVLANVGVTTQSGGPTGTGSVGYAAATGTPGVKGYLANNLLGLSLGDPTTGFYGGGVGTGGPNYAFSIFAYQNPAHGTTFALEPFINKMVLGGVGGAGITSLRFSGSDVRATADDVGISRDAANVGQLDVDGATIGDEGGTVAAGKFIAPTISNTSPTYVFAGHLGSGFGADSAGVYIDVANAPAAGFAATGVAAAGYCIFGDSNCVAHTVMLGHSAGAYTWTTSVTAPDTQLSSPSAGVVSCDTGTLGNSACTVKAAILNLGGNGAASTPAELLNGTWFSGGSSTTTKPQLLIEPAGATSNNWNTHGTGIGVNAAPGFSGFLLDLQGNGGDQFNVDDAGNSVSRGSSTAGNFIQVGTAGNTFGGTITAAAVTETSVSINGSQTITSVQGSTGTKLAAATGTFTASDFRSTDGSGNEVDSGSSASSFATPGAIAAALPLTTVLTLTTATSDTVTLTGITSSSICTFSPANATAAAVGTVLGYVTVGTNTVTINHAATVALGAIENIACFVPNSP